MNSFDTIIQDLVIANRVLAREAVVDAYGHFSVGVAPITGRPR